MALEADSPPAAAEGGVAVVPVTDAPAADSSDQLRAALAASAVDGHRETGREQEVEVRETHISWVFLAGDRAYKLKKPLTLPFLDYGSPQARLEMCREEIRLNRRLAPRIYLGVRSLVPGPGGLRLGPEDDPQAVDHVVEMARYDEADTLAELLARGELRREQVRALGRLLAEFHMGAPEVVGVDSVAVRERELFANLRELIELVEQRSERDRILALERFTNAFLRAHARLIDARARRGMVRECHGDLRADHVLLTEPMQVVDGIEFNPALRELDVADDIAFLAMDLEARRGARFARALMAAYRAAGGDPGTDGLVGFYACHRALVRAKVALLRARQEPASSAEHGRQNAAARELLGVAERFAWRARTPLVVVVCGAPAAGKSRLARRLAKLAGLPRLSSDVVRKRLAGIEPRQRAGPETYTAEFSHRTYVELGRRAARSVKLRGGAVVDATFRRRADRDAFQEGFGAAAPSVFVECVAPLDVLQARAAARGRRRARVSDASVAVVTRESAAWEPLDELQAESHVIIRSDRPVDDQLTDLVALLDGRLA